VSRLSTQVPPLLTRLRRPEVLALGEPNHGEPAFPALRNDLLAVLVERHGFRAVALETDQVRGLAVDDWVRGGDGDLDDVLATGLSHGWGAHPANRELLRWLRARNDARPPADRVAFHGVDAPLEYGPPPSPRPHLEHLHDYLAAHAGPPPHDRARLAELLGADERWTEPEAFHDATRSVGATPEALALRAVTDDLLVALHAHAPALVAATSPACWYRAEVHGRAALGLLRYHARAARPDAPAVRISGMLAVRDVLIAENLLAVHAQERHRGPVLVFAHNGHLQRHPVRWRQPDLELEWAVAGGLVAQRLGDRYAFVAGSLGASGAVGLAAPATGTIEAALPVVHGELVDPGPFRDAGLVERTDVRPEQGHFPLTPALLADADALLHVAAAPPGPTLDELADRIAALPGVVVEVAGDGAPEVSRGDRFFYTGGGDRRRPFATIVSRDVPGFDEASRLDRPGVFRLNVELGRRGFTAEFGYPPAELPAHLPDVDAARLDTVIPHPAYGTYGWASVLNPGPASLPEVDRLLAAALARRRRAPLADG
jgi:erythromycin esterase-like protein